MSDEIKSQKTAFVPVVDADGNPIPGFSDPVPEHWFGTSLLPVGAKKGEAAAGVRAQASDSSAIDAAVKAATEPLEAKIAELEGQVADLTKEPDEAKKVPAPKP